MPDRVADTQTALALAIEQDGKNVVRDHLFHVTRDIHQKPVEVERLRCGIRNVQQKIQQLGALLKTDSGFTSSCHGMWRHALACPYLPPSARANPRGRS